MYTLFKIRAIPGGRLVRMDVALFQMPNLVVDWWEKHLTAARTKPGRRPLLLF